jgi:prepilin-type N-terminal cleavage/methylation domain-containing protein
MQRSRRAPGPGRAVRDGPAGNERGLSLLELVVAISVLAIVLFGVAATIDTGLGLTRNNKNRSVAANLASQEMDLIRSSDFVSLVAGSSTQSVNGVPYTVNRELTWVPRDATNGPCDGANGDPELLRIRVWVTWPSMNGVKAPAADTVLTPPIGAYDPNSGHISVKVLDRAAAPVYNITVSISGPTSGSAPTNSDGCAFFAFRPAGTYTVSLNTTNWVDRQGYQNPSDAVGVTVGAVSSVQFDYDQRAQINVNAYGAVSSSVPGNYSYTIANTGLLPAGVRSYTGSTNPRTINNLFPATDGYSVWAGSCADADPEGLDIDSAPYYSGAQRSAPLTTTPAVTTDTDLYLNPVRIVVANEVGPVDAHEVVITHAADHVCASGESFVAGYTAADGTLDAELPCGTWTVSITGHSAQTTYPTVAISPLDGSPRPDVNVLVLG